MSWPIAIAGAGAFTAVGLTAAQIAASVRAGISRIAETGVASVGGDPYRAGFVTDAYLEDVDGELGGVPRDSQLERLIRLAAPALREACQGFNYEMPPPALFLGIDAAALAPADSPRRLLENLSRQAQVRLNLAESRVFPGGRTAGLVAVVEACQRLSHRDAPPILVGGVDSYRDQDRLTGLDLDGRILTDTNLDGFLPGEGAGIVLLARPGDSAVPPTPLALLAGAAMGFEKGHLGAQEPMLGDGLTQTFQTLFASLPRDHLPCAATLANLNGESFGAKQWGVALLRNRSSFVENPAVYHPAECFGEAGAAMGPILIAIAASWIERKVRAHPFLVWCAADEGPCVACYVIPHAAKERWKHVRDR